MASERWLCSHCGATSDPSPEPPPDCNRCDAPLHVGKFGLLSELAPERSARVFRGRESSGRAEVTVRLFPTHLDLDLSSIRQAVKRAAPLSHPAIAAPLDAGTHRNQVFVVEAAAPGIAVTEADVTFREGVGLMRDVALALDYAHGRGVVHPDLRAENIRISRDAGRSIGDTGWRATINGFGIAEGGSVRDNVGAFGSILYAAATGREPSKSAPVPPSSINPLVNSELEAVILLAMDSNGSRQPPSMEQIASELAHWLDGGARPPTAPKAAPAASPPSDVRHPWQTWSILGASVVVVLLLIYLVIRKAPPPLESVPVVRTPPSQPADVPPPGKPEPPAEAPKPPEEKPAPPKPDPAEEKPAPPPKPAPVEEKPAPPPPKPAAPEEKPAPPKPAPVEEKPAPPPKPTPTEEKPAPPSPPKPAPVEEKPAPPPPKPAPVEEKPAPAPAPKPEPVPAPPPPPPPPPKPVEEKAPAAGASVGEMYGGHPDFGKFVRLNGKENPVVGDILLVLRNGKVVGKLSVKRLTAAQRRYPQGAAVCAVLEGDLQDGDDVRRASK